MTHDNEHITIDQVQALNRLMVDYSKAQAITIKHLRTALIVVCICFTAIICTMIVGFFKYESQFETVDTIQSEDTTSTYMYTEGENANINNVSNGDMYNDNAVHNE